MADMKNSQEEFEDKIEKVLRKDERIKKWKTGEKNEN